MNNRSITSISRLPSTSMSNSVDSFPSLLAARLELAQQQHSEQLRQLQGLQPEASQRGLPSLHNYQHGATAQSIARPVAVDGATASTDPTSMIHINTSQSLVTPKLETTGVSPLSLQIANNNAAQK